MLALVGTTGLARAQDTVASSSAEIVRLDAVVTDGDGSPVPGLSAGDFAVFEDGRRQTITHFAAMAGSTPEATPGEEREAGRRFVVILVDDLHIAPGDLATARETLKRLADGFVVGGAEVALLETSSRASAYAFRQGAELEAAIDALGTTHVAPVAASSDMAAVTAELVLAGDRRALALASRELIDDPTSLVDTTGPRATVAGQRGGIAAGIDPSEQAAAEEAQRQARTILEPALRFSATTLERLEDIVRGLAALPGRKTCLLVSDGFLVGEGTSLALTRELERVADAATRSGTAVYAFDVEGLKVTASGATASAASSTPGLRQSVAGQGQMLYRRALEHLSSSTGGFLIRGTAALETSIRQLLEESHEHYVLAYTPAGGRRDGKFRRIEVKLPDQRSYVVRTRSGYFAPGGRDDRPATEGRVAGALSDEAVWALLEAEEARSRIPVRLTPGFLEGPPLGSQILVRGHLDLRDVSFRAVDSRYRGAVDVFGGAWDEAGRRVGRPFRRRAELDWSDAEHREGLAAGLAWEDAVAVPPGRYEVRVLVQDGIGSREGAARQWVDVPDLALGKLAMSAVFLGSRDQVATGGRRFKRSEDLSFQFYVYNPLVDPAGHSDVVRQAQVWAGGKTIAASRPELVVFGPNDAEARPQGDSFPLASLDPGAYELRVVVIDRKAGATVSGTAEFTVE